MEVFFYLFAIAAVLSALGVLLMPNPVYCALSLVLSFFCLGSIYILINAEFVAVIQILVYAGAIMVLFLFVLMLLGQNDNSPAPMRKNVTTLLAFGIGGGLLFQLVGLFQGQLSYGVKGIYTADAIQKEGSVALVGRLLFTEYVYPFEIISVLLLVAVIGAVIIAKRKVN